MKYKENFEGSLVVGQPPFLRCSLFTITLNVYSIQPPPLHVSGFGAWALLILGLTGDVKVPYLKSSDGLSSILVTWHILSSLHRFADHFTRHMKKIVIALFAGATVSLAIFTLMCAGILPFSKPILFLTCILGGLFVNGTIPLFFELGVESTYPIAEGITSGCLTFSNNFLQIIFYIFPMIPNFGMAWVNWCTFIACGACIPLLCVWREKYYRSEVDKKDSYFPPPHHKELDESIDNCTISSAYPSMA